MRLGLLLLFSGCVASTHAVKTSALGTVRSSDELLAVIDEPGPIELETINSADWAVERSGLINLNHPVAKAAGLTNIPEPIQVYFHALTHPTRGTFLVDTGVEHALRDAPSEAAIKGLVAAQLHVDQMQVHVTPHDWLRAHPQGVTGVFLTHLHIDHISGVPDLPAEVALYAGPGEPGARTFLNLFVQPNLDRQLQGKGPINEWAFTADASHRFAGVIDVFGDGSVWALWVPGHTPGSTAYLVRTTKGPVLLTGDVSHTRWGWEHDVEPGTYTNDQPGNAKTLAQLRALVAEHPNIVVRLGHQP